MRGIKAYKVTSEEKKSIVYGHSNHLALKLSDNVKEWQDKLLTMYWLPKQKLTNLIENTFHREGSPFLACNDMNAFLTSDD